MNEFRLRRCYGKATLFKLLDIIPALPILQSLIFCKALHVHRILVMVIQLPGLVFAAGVGIKYARRMQKVPSPGT